MTSQQEIRQQVREILGRVIPDIDAELKDNDDIFSAGIDSVSGMLLITELEKSFSISLESDEISYDNFRTVTGISEFIETILNRRGKPVT
jgi:methoxymalonate biosynthesis acyl carrier protein